MAWETSDRRLRLPSDWPKIKARAKARDRGLCQAAKHAPHCDRVGTEVDHIRPGDDHHLENLQLLSTSCHQAKTAAEAAARNRAIAQLRKRPTEDHPGRIHHG